MTSNTRTDLNDNSALRDRLDQIDRLNRTPIALLHHSSSSLNSFGESFSSLNPPNLNASKRDIPATNPIEMSKSSESDLAVCADELQPLTNAMVRVNRTPKPNNLDTLRVEIGRKQDVRKNVIKYASDRTEENSGTPRGPNRKQCEIGGRLINECWKLLLVVLQTMIKPKHQRRASARKRYGNKSQSNVQKNLQRAAALIRRIEGVKDQVQINLHEGAKINLTPTFDWGHGSGRRLKPYNKLVEAGHQFRSGLPKVKLKPVVKSGQMRAITSESPFRSQHFKASRTRQIHRVKPFKPERHLVFRPQQWIQRRPPS